MIYYILPILVILFQKKYRIIPIGILILLSGLRGINVGSDTEMYVTFFKFQSSIVEIGFQNLINILNKWTDNYKIFFLIIASFNIFIYMKSLKKRKIKDLTLGLFLYITTYVYIEFNFNMLRQGIATTIVWYSTNFLEEKKYYKFIILIFIATLFHKTAIIGFIFFFVYFIKSKKIYLVCLLGAILFSVKNYFEYIVKFLIINIDFLNKKYYIYLNSDFLNSHLKITTIILICLKILPLLYIKNKNKNKKLEYENFYYFYIIIEILFARYLVLRRLTIYFIYYIILFIIKNIETKKSKIFIELYFYIYYGAFLIQNFCHIIPYSF